MENSLKRLFAFLMAMSFSGLVHAGIYKWVDANGKIHFSDHPPPHVESREIKLRINTYENSRISVSNGVFVPENSVVLYSTAWCGSCKRAKAYFRQFDIPYTEYDVEKSQKGRRDYRTLNGKGVPIILVGKYRLDGFSADRFEQLYQQR